MIERIERGIQYEQRNDSKTGAGGSGPGGDTDTPSDELWIMQLRVVAVSPIYTGENKIESQKLRKTGNRLPTRMSGDGFATVNISGLIRSYVEKIYKDENTCDIGKAPKGCGRCISCKMFGYLGRKGRISVDELKSELPFNKIVSVAVHPRIDRESGTIPQDRGASIEVEEIQEGAVLLGKILIRNPKDKDVEVLDAALKAIESGGVGGWTRRGKGRVSIAIDLKKLKWSSYKEIGKEDAKKLLGKE